MRKAWALLFPACLGWLVAGCDSGAPGEGPSGLDASSIHDGATGAEAATGDGGEAGSPTDGAVEGSSDASDAGDAGGDAACPTCMYGCFAGACTGPLTSVGGTSAALTANAAAVTLVQTTPNGSSTGGGPVSHTDSVTVTTTTQPGGAYLTVTLTWALDPAFSTSTPVTMTLQSSTQAADTWTGVIPAQAAGSEVYFNVTAKPNVGATAYDPNGFAHDAYAVN